MLHQDILWFLKLTLLLDVGIEVPGPTLDLPDVFIPDVECIEIGGDVGPLLLEEHEDEDEDKQAVAVVVAVEKEVVGEGDNLFGTEMKALILIEDEGATLSYSSMIFSRSSSEVIDTRASKSSVGN